MATIIATSLVLFTAGIIATLFISVNDAIDNVKEKFAVDIFLNPTSETAIQDSIIPVIQSFPEVKSVVYISPEEAKQIMIDLNGKAFFSVHDNNRIAPSVKVKLHANFINDQALTLCELEVIDTFGERISEVS